MTFAAGEKLALGLKGGEMIMLRGGLGAGKTLFTKGLLSGLGYDIDEVTSPSFTLVNLYPTERFDVYHIDLWRIEPGAHAAEAVGLDELVDDVRNIIVIEWAERLADTNFDRELITVDITGDGDDPREITISP